LGGQIARFSTIHLSFPQLADMVEAVGDPRPGGVDDESIHPKKI